MNQSPSLNEIIHFSRQYARQYLSSGGPTSRLEENLDQLGRHFHCPTETFATPTGVFITCTDGEGRPVTAVTRIKDTQINLGELTTLERTLGDVLKNKISLNTASTILKEVTPKIAQYPSWHFAFAAFVSGFVVSFDAYQSMRAAWFAGVICFCTWLVTGPLFKNVFPSSVFRDFFGAFLALSLASGAQYFFPVSLEAYSIGALVLLVPGLLLTNAISELAEQNLVSGTAKFMQALLIVSALGMAYVLFNEISHALNLGEVLAGTKQKTRVFGISVLAVISSVYCYGVIFRVPPRTLFWTTLTGLCGWLAFKLLSTTPLAVVSAYFASVVVGILSLSFGRFFQIPSQIYSVPGMMALLPGMLALSSFRLFASGQEESGAALGFKVALTAVSIVLGLMTARTPFILWRTYFGQRSTV